MKIPSEGELIEIERRGDGLPRLADYLRRKAGNLYCMADTADSAEREAQLTKEAHSCELEARRIDRLSEDLPLLLEIARSSR